jgi:hypothetical protein
VHSRRNFSIAGSLKRSAARFGVGTGAVPNIHDLHCDTVNCILKLADDTKLFSRITKDANRKALQTDLSRLFRWFEYWQMPFHIDKGKVLHPRRGNARTKYYMNDLQLQHIKQERDL